MPDLAAAKASLRRKIRDVRRSAYSGPAGAHNRDAEGEQLSHMLGEILTTQLEGSATLAIAAFVPTRLEPNLVPLLESMAATRPDVTVFVPRFETETTLEWVPYTAGDFRLATERPGFGPAGGGAAVATSEMPPLAAIIMPGLAGTMKGMRLGQGGGYYDRALRLMPRCLRILVLHPHEVFRSLPVDENDEPVDLIVTSGGMCHISV